MELQEKKARLQSIEFESQVKLCNTDQASYFVDENQHGILEFDLQLIRLLIKKSPSSNICGVHVQR